MTSRQGLGVGGGTYKYSHLTKRFQCKFNVLNFQPYGFDVGESERGNVLRGLDLGVQGMKVGGQRLLIVPPELAYGSKGVQEIPPNATIELDVELLAIKQSPFGSPVKIVEG
uniref:peptidylprolyl isomerase n=1 Tax=Quercus lobata TaxID=97700 RepID=A0A7N2M6X8_QUELO